MTFDFQPQDSAIATISHANRPPSRRSGHAASPLVPIFRLVPVDDAAWASTSRSRDGATVSPNWCSAPEFCRFVTLTDGDFTPSAA